MRVASRHAGCQFPIRRHVSERRSRREFVPNCPIPFRLVAEDISYPIDTKSSGIRGRWDLERIDYEYGATWNSPGRTRKPTASRRRKPTSDRGHGGRAVQQGQIKGIDHRRPPPTTVAS